MPDSFPTPADTSSQAHKELRYYFAMSCRLHAAVRAKNMHEAIECFEALESLLVYGTSARVRTACKVTLAQVDEALRQQAPARFAGWS